MPPTEKIETETFHNQRLTNSAVGRLDPVRSDKPKRKLIALQLDEKEQAALAYLGGVSGLKRLLCPEGLCIKCRVRSSMHGDHLNDLCQTCLQVESESQTGVSRKG